MRHLLTRGQVLLDHSYHRSDVLECPPMRIAAQVGQIKHHALLDHAARHFVA